MRLPRSFHSLALKLKDNVVGTRRVPRLLAVPGKDNSMTWMRFLLLTLATILMGWVEPVGILLAGEAPPHPADLRCEYLAESAGHRRAAATAELDTASCGPAGTRRAADGLSGSGRLLAGDPRCRPRRPLGFRQGRLRSVDPSRICRPAAGIGNALLLESSHLGPERPDRGLERAGVVVDGIAEARRIGKRNGSALKGETRPLGPKITAACPAGCCAESLTLRRRCPGPRSS